MSIFTFLVFFKLVMPTDRATGTTKNFGLTYMIFNWASLDLHWWDFPSSLKRDIHCFFQDGNSKYQYESLEYRYHLQRVIDMDNFNKLKNWYCPGSCSIFMLALFLKPIMVSLMEVNFCRSQLDWWIAVLP